MGPDPERLARNLRALRQARGLTQQALCEAAGLSRAYLAALERGLSSATRRPPRPTWPLLEAIARSLAVSLDDLVAGDGHLNEVPPPPSQVLPGWPVATLESPRGGDTRWDGLSEVRAVWPLTQPAGPWQAGAVLGLRPLRVAEDPEGWVIEPGVGPVEWVRVGPRRYRRMPDETLVPVPREVEASWVVAGGWQAGDPG